MESTVRVLLVDDHDLFREGLAGIISAQSKFQVVGEARDGIEAVVMAESLNPDLILMDIQMPGMDGIEATQRIKASRPDIVIVMLTVRSEDEKLFSALKAGAQGYLLKDTSSKELIEMMRSACRGEAAIHPSLAVRVLAEFRRLASRSSGEDVEDGLNLTPREQEILGHISQGASDKEIAETLSLSLHTVKSHVRNILAKLQVGSRREAARLAQKKGLF